MPSTTPPADRSAEALSRRDFGALALALAAAPLVPPPCPAAAAPAGQPDVLPMVPAQPHPLRTRVAKMPAGGRIVTAIMRQWRPGDMGRCRLCDRCDAYGDGCLVIANFDVPREDAPLFNSVGLMDRTPRPRPEGRRRP